jgi:hypothetical protein
MKVKESDQLKAVKIKRPTIIKEVQKFIPVFSNFSDFQKGKTQSSHQFSARDLGKSI